jgi:glycosyltransferase involved in cell wall biosynthesis
MVNAKKVVVVMPAYNAEKTLRMTYDEVMAQEIVDLVILVDDASSDRTHKIARALPYAMVLRHDWNQGYGAN